LAGAEIHPEIHESLQRNTKNTIYHSSERNASALS
jgi:hypothetical protein